MNKKNLFDDPLTDDEINDILDSEWYIGDEDVKEEKKETKCCCGSEKVYGKNATHMSYCPKYKPFKSV